MKPTVLLSATHEFLRVAQGTTAEAMFDELSRLRRLGSPWEGVPEDLDGFIGCLNRLALSGLAERSGDLWLWMPARKAEAIEREAQRSLFA